MARKRPFAAYIVLSKVISKAVESFQGVSVIRFQGILQVSWSFNGPCEVDS